jgi:hypothetical protein
MPSSPYINGSITRGDVTGSFWMNMKKAVIDTCCRWTDTHARPLQL